MPGRNVMLESISDKWHLCFRSASELETGTNHFLVAARVEFGTGNRHVPFFRSCPAWSSAWSSPQSWGDKKKACCSPPPTGLEFL